MNFRETVLHETLLIFEKNGIEEVSIEMLTEALAISKGTLLEIADSKKKLVQLCIAHSIKVRWAVVEHVIAEADNPLEALLVLLQLTVEEVYSLSPEFVHDLQKFYPHSWSRLQHFLQLFANRHLHTLLVQSINEGYLSPDLQTDLVIRLLLNNLQGLLNRDLFPAMAFDYQDLFKTLMVNYLKGCASTEGQHLIEAFGASSPLEAK